VFLERHRQTDYDATHDRGLDPGVLGVADTWPGHRQYQQRHRDQSLHAPATRQISW
jgi:hypothetical protein